MTTDVIILRKLSNLLDRINNTMRVVWIGSIKANCIGVNQRFHVTNVSLEFIIQLGLTNFNVEVHGSLEESSMNGVRNNSE